MTRRDSATSRHGAPRAWALPLAPTATVLLVIAAACAPRGPEDPSAARPATEVTNAAAPEPEPELEPFRVLSPSERVPPFRVRAVDGTLLDSAEWIGQRAFVVVFFATWCDVCELKLPVVHHAVAERSPPTPIIGVAIDDGQTWGRVAEFARQHGIDYPIVRADHYPRFALAYGPMQTVPAVAVIGQNGYLVDYQVGYGRSHAERMARALGVAHAASGAEPARGNEVPTESLDSGPAPR